VFGLDQLISGLAHGSAPVVVLGVAVLLGLRHATDPDHLVAVSTLVATARERRARRASWLGLAWGLGHATSLLAAGLPFVLVAAVVPDAVREAAEILVGVVIMALAARLLVRRRRGRFHAHVHEHDGVVHRHVHLHAASPRHHEHGHRVRTPVESYAIGVVHGLGGSAAVAVLLLAAIGNELLAAVALAVFAAAAAIAMAAASAALGLALGRRAVERRFRRMAPAFVVAAFAFGAWYAAGALASAL
jgi:high-affinity nickel permease